VQDAEGRYYDLLAWHAAGEDADLRRELTRAIAAAPGQTTAHARLAAHLLATAPAAAAPLAARLAASAVALDRRGRAPSPAHRRRGCLARTLIA